MVTLTQAIECIEQGKIRYEKIDSKDLGSVKQNELNKHALETILDMLKHLKCIHHSFCFDSQYLLYRTEFELKRTFIDYPRLRHSIEEGQTVVFRNYRGAEVTMVVDNVIEDCCLHYILVQGTKDDGGRAEFTYNNATFEDRIVSIDGLPLADLIV